jgi:hypothetical protein
MKMYRDIENNTIISEKELYDEFMELYANDGEHTTFEDYIINCTDKNGFLERIN